VPKGVTVSLLSVLGIYVALQGNGLWREWRSMRRDVEHANRAAVIAFPNVYSRPSLAARPEQWVRREGDSLLLWAGWDPGRDHHWFRARKGDLDGSLISEPIGRDVIIAIDDPLVERGGGAIWERLPADSQVVGHTVEGTTSAYPISLLKQVCAVNDLIEERPYLVSFSLEAVREQPVAVYDARVNGHRVILRTAGFLLHGRPVLYDRESESLWVEDGDAVRAVSGAYRNSVLPLVSRMTPTPWSTWRAHNPQSRLVVGNRPRPATVATK
jgi:hypothetical protein